MNGWTDGQMNGWADGGMEGGMEGGKDGIDISMDKITTPKNVLTSL